MQQAQLSLSTTKLAQQRIYINSFTQRVLGNDVEYTVDLGRPFTIKQSIQLDQNVMENLFSNFYQTIEGDYRDLSFVDSTGAYIQIFVDQNLGTTQQLIDFLNDAIIAQGYDYYFQLIPGPSYLNTITLRLKTADGGDMPWYAVGFGFNKLGLIQEQVPIPFIPPTQHTHEGKNFCDLSQPSSFLIAIDNLPFSISSGKGSALFSIPNTSSFGSKNIYTNTQQSTCQTLYLQNPTTISQLNIRILNCDQMPINTIKARNQAINQTNSEHIFVLTIQ